jgi:hypothetical protein
MGGAMSSVVISGDTSGSITLQAPAVSGATTLTLPAVSGTVLQSGTTVTEAQGGTGTTIGHNSFKNRIINGAMQIDQRNAGAVVTASGSCILDRFINYRSGGAYTVQRSTTAPPGFVNSMLMTNTTAASPTTFSFFGQIIEGLNIADFGFGTANAQTVTVSFWANSSVTGIYSISVTNGNGDRAYPVQYTINTANTWEYKTITVPGDTSGTWATNNTSGIFLRFNLGSPSGRTAAAGAWVAGNYDGANGSTGATTWANTTSATFYITGVQFEKGSTATSFDYRSYGTELQLCQRYCWNVASDTGILTMFNGVSRGSGTYFYNIPTPVAMRTTPSFSVGGTGTVRITYAGTEVNSSANSSTVGGAAPTFNFGTSVANRTSILMSYETVTGVTSGAGRADVGLTFNYGTFIFNAEL